MSNNTFNCASNFFVKDKTKNVSLGWVSAKEFVGSVYHVEKSILISLLVINLVHGGRHTGETLVVH